jgi:hypothetical protein
MPDDLTSTAGIVALVGCGLALLALLLAGFLARRLRRIQRAQEVVLGESGTQDLVAHAQTLHYKFDHLWAAVNDQFENVGQRLNQVEYRLTRAISQAAVVRYDAYGDLSGRQSSSIALLDEAGNGVVMSSILHRDQARLYVKGVRDGEPEYELSPEELQAIEVARQSSARQQPQEQAEPAKGGEPGAGGAPPGPPPGAPQPGAAPPGTMPGAPQPHTGPPPGAPSPGGAQPRPQPAAPPPDAQSGDVTPAGPSSVTE